MLQTQIHEFSNCFKCLSKRVPVYLIFTSSFFGGIIFLFSIRSYIFHTSIHRLMMRYFSLPGNPNLFQQLGFFSQLMIPIFFSLHFLSDDCLVEFLFTRLQSKWTFIAARLVIIYSILILSFFARIVALSLWCCAEKITAWGDLLSTILCVAQRFFFEVTFLSLVFYCFNKINGVVIFIVAGFLISLSTATTLPNLFFFWVNGLDYSQVNMSLILPESLLNVCITILSLLPKNRYLILGGKNNG